MKTAQTLNCSLTVKQGIKSALAIFLLATALGCQRMRVRSEQTPALESMPSNTEKLLSQVKQLEENQQGITESVESIKMDQLTIGTKLASAQRQLAKQLAENAQAIQQEQVDLKATVQDANTQFTQQFQGATERQQGLKRAIETIHAHGQTLAANHDQVLTQLAEHKQGYQYWQDEWRLMQEKMTALDARLVAMQARWDQFQIALTTDIQGLTEGLASRQAVERDIAEQLATLTRLLQDRAELPKRPLTLFPDFGNPAKTQAKVYSEAFRREGQQNDRASRSSPTEAKTKPGVDSLPGP